MTKRYESATTLLLTRPLSLLAVAGLLSFAMSSTALAQDAGLCCQYGAGGGLIGCNEPLTSGQCDATVGVGDTVAVDWVFPFSEACSQVFFGDCQAFDPNLPVELTSFEAVSGTNGSITLRWETASELNNSGFEVEQASNGGEFAQIAFVAGRGTTNEPSDYSHVVTELDPGSHAFRLKQVDFDGAFEYSAIVEATVEVPSGYALEEAYPNPFNPSTTIRFAVGVEQSVRVALYDATGREVQSLYSGVAPANSMVSVSVDGSALASGTYQVRMEAGDVVLTRSIVLAK